MSPEAIQALVAAEAAFSAPASEKSESSDTTTRLSLTDVAIVRMTRPDGRRYLLRVPAEHLDRLIDLAAAEFGGVVTEE